jgi:hypothetical protein
VEPKDWCTIIPGIGTVIGTFFNAWVIWRVTKTDPEKKEKEDRKAKLLAGLAALEKSRRTLLTFKHQYISQRAKDATRLAHYIANFRLVEQYINKAIALEKGAQTSISQSLQLNIPNPRFLANLAKLMNDDSTHKEIKDTVNISIVNEGIANLYSLSEEQIQKLYLLIYDNPILFPQSPNTSFAEKSIPTKDFPEKLYFVANYNPGILIGMEQVTENLTQLNLMTTQWNKHIKRHQTIKDPSVQDMTTHIGYFLSFSNSIYEIGVEGTLMSLKTSMDHLKEYACNHYKDHKSFEIYEKSFHKELMPELDEAAKNIKENLNCMRIE